MRLAQYFAGIFHNMLPNISRPSIFRGLSPQYLPAWASLYNVRPRYLDKRPSLRNIFLHGSSLFLHGSSLSLHEPSLYNARPRYLYKRPSN